MFLKTLSAAALALMLGGLAATTGASAAPLASVPATAGTAETSGLVKVRGGFSLYIGPGYGYGYRGYGYRDYSYYDDDDDYYYPRRRYYRYYDGDRHYRKYSRRWTRERFQHPLGRR